MAFIIKNIKMECVIIILQHGHKLMPILNVRKKSGLQFFFSD